MKSFVTPSNTFYANRHFCKFKHNLDLNSSPTVEHLLRFSAWLTSSFNLNYWNGGTERTEFNLYWKSNYCLYRTWQCQAKNDSHKENQFSEAVMLVINVAISC